MKIDEENSNNSKKKKNYNKDLEKRNIDVKNAVEAYDIEDTYEVKLQKLHLLASKLTIDVNVDITDENCTKSEK